MEHNVSKKSNSAWKCLADVPSLWKISCDPLFINKHEFILCDNDTQIFKYNIDKNKYVKIGEASSSNKHISAMTYDENKIYYLFMTILINKY